METFDSVAVAKWAVDKLAAAVAAFRDGLAPFGPVAARYEVALKAGNDPAALDSLVGQVLRGELLVIPDEI